MQNASVTPDSSDLEATAGHAIELVFSTLKKITAILAREPTIVHVPAQPDRSAQLSHLDQLTTENRHRQSVVILTSFPDREVIRWPYDDWEFEITRPNGYVCRSGRQIPPPASMHS